MMYREPDSDWARAIATGAPPFLRYADPAFATASTPAGVEAGHLWRSRVAEHEPGLDAAALATVGLDLDCLGQAFGDARLEDHAPLPDWARILVTAVDLFPREQQRHDPAEDSIQAATDCFREAAAVLLRWHELVDRYHFLGERALSSFTRHLATRVVMSCAAVLELETMQTDEVTWDFTRPAWRQRLLGFPGLNYVMGTAIRQWHQNALELIDRLGRDFPAIRSGLLGGQSVGDAANIDFDLGDRHHDGRSVSIITFDSGASVVYKPKDLRCADRFWAGVATINEECGDRLANTFRILPRDGYCWEEYVAQGAITGRADTACFFERYGALLRLLQLVEGRDFWVDNLRVSGGFPVFVDLECIFQPRIDGLGFQVHSPDVDGDLFDESVLPTAAVTQAMDVEGFGRQDFGGLAGNGPRALPLGLWSGYRDRDNGNILLRNGRLFWVPDVLWPETEGQPASAHDFLEDLDRGYRVAQAAIGRSAGRLRAADGPFGDLAGLNVRALLRSTWEYLPMLRVSLNPTSLLSGVDRENSLARVFATAPAWGDRSRVTERLRVAWSEVDSLRRLDVPEFLSNPASSTVFDIEGNPLGDLFSGTAQERLGDRLAGVDDFETDSHAQILRIGVQLIHAPGVPQ
jgi:Domain of unknown function (DUF4135)